MRLKTRVRAMGSDDDIWKSQGSLLHLQSVGQNDKIAKG